MEAYELCQEREGAFTDEGLTIAHSPIELVGTSWKINWDDGHTQYIAYTFNDELTLHRDEGRLPFAVAYGGEVFMIIPYPATVEEDTWCDVVPLI